MWENTTTGANILQSIPISEFLSALIGGGLTFAGTIYSLRHQQNQRNNRLRRALISEINSIESGQLHTMVSMLRTDEGGSDFLDEFVEDHFNDVAEELREELVDTNQMKKETMRKTGQLISSVNLSTPIWDSNTDKIGNLETDGIEKLIRFYRLVNMCKQHAGDAVDAVEREIQLDDEEDSDSTESFERHMRLLQKNARALAEMKRGALEALDADEFIEVEDSYLIYTGDEVQVE